MRRKSPIMPPGGETSHPAMARPPEPKTPPSRALRFKPRLFCCSTCVLPSCPHKNQRPYGHFYLRRIAYLPAVSISSVSSGRFLETPTHQAPNDVQLQGHHGFYMLVTQTTHTLCCSRHIPSIFRLPLKSACRYPHLLPDSPAHAAPLAALLPGSETNDLPSGDLAAPGMGPTRDQPSVLLVNSQTFSVSQFHTIVDSPVSLGGLITMHRPGSSTSRRALLIRCELFFRRTFIHVRPSRHFVC